MEDINKKQQKYEQLFQFGTNEQKKELVFEDMDILEREVFAKALASNLIRSACNEMDMYLETRAPWKEFTHSVGKEMVLQIIKMWL